MDVIARREAEPFQHIVLNIKKILVLITLFCVGVCKQSFAKNDVRERIASNGNYVGLQEETDVDSGEPDATWFHENTSGLEMMRPSWIRFRLSSIMERKDIPHPTGILHLQSQVHEEGWTDIRCVAIAPIRLLSVSSRQKRPIHRNQKLSS